jgi:fatty acid CoA ligase FadD9
MSAPANARARLQRRFDKLTSGDPQLTAAEPDPAITAAIDGPDPLLADVIRTVMTGVCRPGRPRPASRRIRHRHI